jgi:MFS family permease
MNREHSQEDSQFALLRSRYFLPYFITQFLGALNDNVFKNAMVIVLAYRGGSILGLSGPILVNLAAALFILPYIFLSARAGQWADKFEKTGLMRWVKLAEIGIMLLGAVGFISNRAELLFIALFLMGCHSTVFGPAKYALLPQHIKSTQLVGANGLVEMGTFLAILLGTLLGGGLVASHEIGVLPICIATLFLAVAGYISCRWIPLAPSADPDLKLNTNLLGETWRTILVAQRDRTMWMALLANSWFWFYGATFLTQFPSYAKEILNGDETVTVLLLAALSAGIGVGSLLCERFSKQGLNLGLVILGLIGMTAFAGVLPLISSASEPTANAPLSAIGVTVFLLSPIGVAIILTLIGMGLSAGLYIVPLYALIQSRSDPKQVSRMIAANNVMNAFAMILSSVMAILLFSWGASILNVFQTCALATAMFATVLWFAAPEYSRALSAWFSAK